MRLFVIRDPKGKFYTNPDGSLVTFQHKMLAKRHRDSLGQGYTVTYGPDHKKNTNVFGG